MKRLQKRNKQIAERVRQQRTTTTIASTNRREASWSFDEDVRKQHVLSEMIRQQIEIDLHHKLVSSEEEYDGNIFYFLY